MVSVNTVTTLVESKKAQLVVIAHDVDPIEPKGKKAKGKKVAPAPSVLKKHAAKKVVNPLFEKRPKNYGIDPGRARLQLPYLK
ncbi:UNVERIFIED_CONTAM: hypothetical protein FKN15_053784 [Acipenser sinensis]